MMDDKIKFLNDFILQIERCNEKDWDLIETKALNSYGDSVRSTAIQLQYDKNIEFSVRKQTLITTLINEISNVRMENEKITLRQSTINIDNHNVNNNNNTNNVSVNVSLNETLDSLQQLDENIINKEVYKELEEKLLSIEGIKALSDDNKTASKAGQALKYVADKGPEILKIVLPYIVSALN